MNIPTTNYMLLRIQFGYEDYLFAREHQKPPVDSEISKKNFII